MTDNRRYLVSRNRREGFYNGKQRDLSSKKDWSDCDVKHFRSKVSLKNLSKL